MRVVLDLSTSLAWKRQPVGIVRTELKFAERCLRRTDLDLAFCRFDPEAGAHVEVPRRQVTARLACAAVEAAAGGASVSSGHGAGASGWQDTSPPERVRDHVKALARAVLSRLPGDVQPAARDALHHGARLLASGAGLAGALRGRIASRLAGRAGVIAPWTSRAAEASNRRGPASRARFEFEPSDVYVSMGLDWDYNSLGHLLATKERDGMRVVLFCHDLIPVKFPHLVASSHRLLLSNHFVELARTADHIVAVSTTTRDDLEEFLHTWGLVGPQVSVVSPGADAIDATRLTPMPVLSLAGREFVLYVSTIQVRKNHELLYNVWERLVERYGERVPVLVWSGTPGWGVSDLMAKLACNPRLAGRVMVLPDVPDAQLIWLYQECLFTVFPSLYEGWGLPVTESLALGKPCICSDTPAVMEAGQGVAVTLDPRDFAAWLAEVERMWGDGEYRRARAALARERFKARSWERSGDELLEVIRRDHALPARR